MSRQGLKFRKMVVPYFFMIATWIPLFLIAFAVPDHVDKFLLSEVEGFIDAYLFSDVGSWSPHFPVVSKLTINYICLFSPFFSIIFCYLTLRKSVMEKRSFDDLSQLKAFFYFLGTTLVVAIFLYVTYFDSTNLANARKLAILAQYKILYAFYAVAQMFLYYVIVLVGYLIYRYVPRALIKSE
ncbi:hypothetical protein C4J86_4544 [Pseudomonas sp. R2-7-07]|nr:hypothetical protein C4J86_4544 [Pseudomonas sp. R2-7-07]